MCSNSEEPLFSQRPPPSASFGFSLRATFTHAVEQVESKAVALLRTGSGDDLCPAGG
jgi:hypothetical protein